ncbi:MAG: hypothetical protein WD313_02480 [Acidimicrobiia bacterium]
MARYIPDGKLRVVWVETLADPSAPTQTEIDGGEDLTGFLRSLSTPLEGSVVDVSDPTTKFNKTAAGTYGGQELTAEWYRDDTQANDTAFVTLDRGATGAFVICRRGGSGTDGAIDTGDFVEVWSGLEVITRNPADYSRNEPDGFSTSFAVQDEPEMDVAVVA